MAGTIKDIARMTNLGLATISAYLNGVPVREKNKLAIEKAIAELNYVRNEYARGLKTRKSMTIGILIPELNNIFSMTIISSIEDILYQKGYGVIVSDCKKDEEKERKSIEFLLSKMIDGVIVMPISTDSKQLQSIIDKNIPLIVIDRLTDANVPHILIDNLEVSKSAVEKLIDAGHTDDIAIITGNDTIYTAKERLKGYKQALESRNIAVNQDNIYDGELTIIGGYNAMKSIIENNKRVGAIFVTNYEMTIGAILAINEMEKKIPTDYSFIGFDNMEMAQIITPKLSTVKQPLEEMGYSAATMLLEIIEQKSNPSNVILNAEYIAGNSIKQFSK